MVTRVPAVGRAVIRGFDNRGERGIIQDMSEHFYTLDEAAEILKVHRRTISRWSDAGEVKLVELPNHRLRVPSSEIARLLPGWTPEHDERTETPVPSLSQ